MEVHRTVTGGTRAASVNSVGLLVPKRPPLMLGCLLMCDNYPPASHAARHSAGALTLRQIRDRCRELYHSKSASIEFLCSPLPTTR